MSNEHLHWHILKWCLDMARKLRIEYVVSLLGFQPEKARREIPARLDHQINASANRHVRAEVRPVD